MWLFKLQTFHQGNRWDPQGLCGMAIILPHLKWCVSHSASSEHLFTLCLCYWCLGLRICGSLTWSMVSSAMACWVGGGPYKFARIYSDFAGFTCLGTCMVIFDTHISLRQSGSSGGPTQEYEQGSGHALRAAVDFCFYSTPGSHGLGYSSPW